MSSLGLEPVGST